MSNETSLGVPASDFYESRKADRTAPVNLGRRMADLTIPSLFPPENYKTGDPLRAMNQSVNARAVNSLSTKLTQVALPPNLPFIKYNAAEGKMQEDIKADPELWGEVQYALSRREQAHRERMETTTARSAYGRAMKLLLVTGNALIIWTDLDNPVVYNMHSYVVKRSATGQQLVIVAESIISAAEAEDDVLEAHRKNQGNASQLTNEWAEDIKLYHVQKLVVDGDKKEWLYWQEVEGGYVIPGSEAWADYAQPHMYAAGLIPDTGSDWYLPYAFDYEGDLAAIETFAAALQDGAAALAWFLFFVDPTGSTKLKDVQEADSLDVLSGKANDVTTLTTQKGGDLSFVSREFEEASRRLGFAFAMHTSIQRPGERVTREEWVQMANDLNQTMGGLYAELAQGIQRWFALRFIYLHEDINKDLKPLPEGLVRVGVVTGIESIGQDTELTNIKEWVGDAIAAMGPEKFAAEIEPNGFLTRTAALRAVKTEGLLKPKGQSAQEQAEREQKMQQQTVLEQGTGPLAKEGASMLAEMMMKQQQGVATDG